MMRALALVGLALLAAPIAAQDDGIPWRLSYFPYPELSPNDGLMGIARVLWFRQAPWGERITLQNSVALEAGYSTRDAWLARVTWANPRLADGWRIVAHGEIGHQPRFGDPDNPVERDRALAWVDVTRQLAGPIHFAMRGGLRHEDYPGLDGPDHQSDATLRGAVVVDLRDREFEVNRGALLEGGVIFGTGGAEGYRALYGHVRGWYNPIPYLRTTARLAWRQPVSRGSFASQHEFPGWEGDFTAVGGHRSHRGLGIGQVGGDGFMLAGGEVRFDVLNVGEMGAVTVLAFLDGGRALRDPGTFCGFGACDEFERHDDWHWGAGGGLALRVLRAATLTITASGGDGETRWYIGSGWSW